MDSVTRPNPFKWEFLVIFRWRRWPKHILRVINKQNSSQTGVSQDKISRELQQVRFTQALAIIYNEVARRAHMPKKFSTFALGSVPFHDASATYTINSTNYND